MKGGEVKIEKQNKVKDIINDCLEYDPSSGVIKWKYSKGLRVKKGDMAGWINRENGYRLIQINNMSFMYHRIAWFLYYGKFPDKFIDHINGNRLDNSIKNLRQVTKSENNYNKVFHRNGNVRGVIRTKGRFHIKIGNKYIATRWSLKEANELATSLINKE